MSAPTIMVGRKPVSSYFLACLHALQQNGSVEARARERAMDKAIGVVQMLREGLMKGVEVQHTDLGQSGSRGRTEGRLG
jgi:DNA-binding protein Alba